MCRTKVVNERLKAQIGKMGKVTYGKMGEVMAQARARSSRKEKKCMQLCSVQPAFLVWWENGRIVQNVRPKSKEKWTFVNTNREAKKHQTEWRVTANNYRCMRCGWSSKKHEDARDMCRTKVVDGRLKVQVGKDVRTRHVEKDG